MRKWASAVAIIVALASADIARADTPAVVYSDFAEDGALSCGHSRSALKGVLKDASLYQYGDPLTFMRLKLAVREQLAGGCRRAAARPPGGSESADSGSSSGGNDSDRGSVATEPTPRAKRSSGASRERSGNRQPRATEGTASTEPGTSEDGGMALLGVSLLLLTLASGGWAARRAFRSSE